MGSVLKNRTDRSHLSDPWMVEGCGKKGITPPRYPLDRKNYRRKSLLRGHIRRNAHRIARHGYDLSPPLRHRFPNTTYPVHRYGQVDTSGDLET